jgi:hypothetical protein
MPIKVPKLFCPHCHSTNVVDFKNLIFCRDCKHKFNKKKYKKFGPDRMMCPECFTLDIVDLGTEFYCKECKVKYEKKKYFPFYRRRYYFCPWCEKKDILDDVDRIYCENCKAWFSKWSIRTMLNGQGKEVWKEKTGLGFMSAVDPDKSGYDD